MLQLDFSLMHERIPTRFGSCNVDMPKFHFSLLYITYYNTSQPAFAQANTIQNKKTVSKLFLYRDGP